MVRTTKSQVQVAIQRLIVKEYLRSARTPADRIRTGTLEATEKAWAWRSGLRNQSAPPAAFIEVGDTLPKRVMGIVGAGNRNVDAEGTDEYMSLPAQHVRGSGVYLLEVAGGSMAGDNLRSGDHVVVDPDARWDDGDMVVVLDQGVSTVKRLFHEGTSFVLEPSNKDVKSTTLEPGWEHLGGQVIQGKVIGLVLWHVEPGHRSTRG